MEIADRYPWADTTMQDSLPARSPVLVLILSVLLVARGCVSPAVHKNVSAFTHAVTLATENTKAAFDTVEQKCTKVQADRIASDYDNKGFNHSTVKQFLNPDELNVRLVLLDALQRYAETLALVSEDQKLQEFDHQTKAFGVSLQALAETTVFQKLAGNSQISRNNIAVATSVTQAITKTLRTATPFLA